MNRRKAVLLAVLLAILASPIVARSETLLGYKGWGVRGGYQIDPDQLFFGAHMDLGQFVQDLHFIPNITIGFGDNVTLLSVSPDLSYWFPVEDIGSLYVGGLLALQWLKYDFDVDIPGVDDSDTEMGIHAIAGLVLKDNPIFFEANLGLDDTPDVKLGVGYTFPR